MSTASTTRTRAKKKAATSSASPSGGSFTESDGKNHTIHVGGIEGYLEDEERLKELFSAYGIVDAVTLRIRRVDGKVSWALIHFKSAACVKRAVAAAAKLKKKEGIVVRPVDEEKANSSTGMMNRIKLKQEQKTARQFAGIDAEKLQAMRSRMKAKSYRHKGQDPRQLLRNYDHDGCGQLDFAEFLDAIRKAGHTTKQDISDKALHQVFKHLDDDGSGMVSVDELTEFVWPAWRKEVGTPEKAAVRQPEPEPERPKPEPTPKTPPDVSSKELTDLKARYTEIVAKLDCTQYTLADRTWQFWISARALSAWRNVATSKCMSARAINLMVRLRHRHKIVWLRRWRYQVKYMRLRVRLNNTQLRLALHGAWLRYVPRTRWRQLRRSQQNWSEVQQVQLVCRRLINLAMARAFGRWKQRSQRASRLHQIVEIALLSREDAQIRHAFEALRSHRSAVVRARRMIGRLSHRDCAKVFRHWVGFAAVGKVTRAHATAMADAAATAKAAALQQRRAAGAELAATKEHFANEQVRHKDETQMLHGALATANAAREASEWCVTHSWLHVSNRIFTAVLGASNEKTVLSEVTVVGDRAASQTDAERNDLRRQVEMLESSAARSRDTQATLREEIAMLRQEQRGLTGANESLEALVESLSQAETRLRERNGALAAQNNKLREDLATLQNKRIDATRQALASREQATRSLNTAADALFKRIDAMAEGGLKLQHGNVRSTTEPPRGALGATVLRTYVASS